jgi:hypothetical protein
LCHSPTMDVEVFFCTVKSELDKVKQCFKQHAAQINSQFDACKLDAPQTSLNTASSSQLGQRALTGSSDSDASYNLDDEISPQHRLMFQRALQQQEQQQSLKQEQQPSNSDNNSNINEFESRITKFLEACRHLSTLRRYTVVNYLILLKILNKYCEYTRRDAAKELQQQ